MKEKILTCQISVLGRLDRIKKIGCLGKGDWEAILKFLQEIMCLSVGFKGDMVLFTVEMDFYPCPWFSLWWSDKENISLPKWRKCTLGTKDRNLTKCQIHSVERGIWKCPPRFICVMIISLEEVGMLPSELATQPWSQILTWLSHVRIINLPKPR